MTAAPRLQGKQADPYFAPRAEFDAYSAFGTPRLGRSRLHAAHFRRDRPDLGLTTPNERSDVLMAVVNLRPQRENDLWCEGRHERRAPMGHGGLAVLDHRLEWTTTIVEPFETVHVFIPTGDLAELGEQVSGERLDTLDCPITSERRDEVMLHLALALLPALATPEQVSTLYADHLFSAIRLHLAQTYGGLVVRDEHFRGGLAPWQERLVTDILLDDLTTDAGLAELADACGVSTRHFTRAFKASHGIPPHRWLLLQKVERAKHLLETTSGGVSEIAQRCGFSDQSHLTRVFHRLVGAPPAAWRRDRRR